MRVGSLPHGDRKSRPGWKVFPLGSAAAGGVGAIFCTADSIAGGQQSSGFSLCVYDNIKPIHPCLSLGLSSESEEQSQWHFHRRTITHSSVSHIFFSGSVLLLLGFYLFFNRLFSQLLISMCLFQVNCDSDPYREFMPLEPSFLITVICAKSGLCPTSLQCPNKTQQDSLQTCWIHSSDAQQVLFL